MRVLDCGAAEGTPRVSQGCRTREARRFRGPAHHQGDKHPAMHISDLITPRQIDPDARAGGKKRALEMLSELLAAQDDRLGRGQVFDSIINRERLGSTAIGAGVAIPHGRIEGLERSLGAFIRLQEPVDFDATDGGPVDMLFALVVPSQCAEEHLAALAELARKFSDPALCQALRAAENGEQIHELLIRHDPDHDRESA